jgi:hypothetical protein
MSSFYPGIDIAKAKFDCAPRLPNGKFRGKSLPNTPTDRRLCRTRPPSA